MHSTNDWTNEEPTRIILYYHIIECLCLLYDKLIRYRLYVFAWQQVRLNNRTIHTRFRQINRRSIDLLDDDQIVNKEI